MLDLLISINFMVAFQLPPTHYHLTQYRIPQIRIFHFFFNNFHHQTFFHLFPKSPPSISPAPSPYLTQTAYKMVTHPLSLVKKRLLSNRIPPTRTYNYSIMSNFFLSLLSILLPFCHSLYLPAIQPQFPIRIDYILFVYNDTMIDSNPMDLNSDTGIHNIQFVIGMAQPPEVVVSVNQMMFMPYQDTQRYRFQVQSTSATGFVLASDVVANTFTRMHLSYFAYIPNIGIKQLFYTIADLAKSTLATTDRYRKVSALTVQNSARTFVYATITRLDLYYSDPSTYLAAQASFSSGLITVALEIGNTNDLEEFMLAVIIYEQLPFQRNLSARVNPATYYFNTGSYTGTTNVTQDIMFNNNVTSTMYSFFGLTKARVGVGYMIGYNLDFNTTTLTNLHDYSSRMIPYPGTISAKYESNTIFPSEFFRLSYWRVECDTPSAQYLNFEAQLCFSNIIKGYYVISPQNRLLSCYKCTDITHCPLCATNACEANQYFNSNVTNFRCDLCTAYHQNCTSCDISQCLSCDPASLQEPVGNSCVSCDSTSFYDSGRCYQCSNPTTNCKECTDLSHCTSCHPNYQLINGECINQDDLIVFGFNVQLYVPKNIDNSIYIYITFQGDITLVKQKYTNITLFNSSPNFSSQTQQFPNNSYLIKLFYTKSSNNNQFTITFQNKTPSHCLNKLSETKQTGKLYYISQEEKRIYDTISDQMSFISDNSGSILTSFSFASVTGYFVNILWNFQIASYYLFIDVEKPRNLILFLNATIEMQSIDLLPFEIPNVYDYYFGMEVEGDPAYQEYGVDLYFMRDNFNNIVSLIINCIFWYLLYLIFDQINCEWRIFEFIKTKFVYRLYSNMSMTFYNVVTTIAFSSSVTLSSRLFSSQGLILNYFAGTGGLIFCLFFTLGHPIILFSCKGKDEIDTEECYIGSKRERKNSELILFVFLCYQISIPLLIPLFPPIFSLTVIILTSISYVVLLIRTPVLKIKICVIYRAIGQGIFVLFNTTFILYHIIQQYFPDMPVETVMILGYISISTLGAVIIMEFVQMITEMVMDLCEFMTKICRKRRIRELNHPSEIKALADKDSLVAESCANTCARSQSQCPTSISTNSVKYDQHNSKKKRSKVIKSLFLQRYSSPVFKKQLGLGKKSSRESRVSKMGGSKKESIIFYNIPHMQRVSRFNRKVVDDVPMECPAEQGTPS